MRPLVIRATNAKGHVRPLSKIEAEAIRVAMRLYKNQSEAARRLHIGRATLCRKLKKRKARQHRHRASPQLVG